MTVEVEVWSISRCWPGEVVALLAGGQSLTQAQVDHCRGRCRVVAINRAYRLAPWADWLWGCDAASFWGRHEDALDFRGEKIVIMPRSAGGVMGKLQALAAAGCRVVRHSGDRDEALSDDPTTCHGSHALHHLLSIIHHTGASTVLLLGADMHGQHWHDGYGLPPPNHAARARHMATLVAPLERRGVAVLNCSPGSAITCWPRVDLEAVL